MAGLVPAIDGLLARTKEGVDARHEAGHDEDLEIRAGVLKRSKRIGKQTTGRGIALMARHLCRYAPVQLPRTLSHCGPAGEFRERP